jgi:hypothetical protein
MTFPVPRLLLVIKNVFHSQTTTQQRLVTTTLYSLEDTINRRQEEIVTEGGGKPSWTKKLLLDAQLLCSKIRYVMFILNFAKGFTVQWQRPPAGVFPPRVQSLGAAQFTRICGLVRTFLLWFRWIHLLNIMLEGRWIHNRVFFILNFVYGIIKLLLNCTVKSTNNKG